MTQPTKWSAPLGSGADVQELPDDDLRYASFSKIFPQITQVPLSAGGVAPRRIDFNSLFKLLADNIYYYQNGGVFEYSATADYEKGALVRYNDKIYLCIQDNSALNTHNPEDMSYWLRVALNNELTDYLPLAGGNVTGNLSVQNKNVVRSVNGVNANEIGNVQLDGLVKSVNGVNADVNGNVTISSLDGYRLIYWETDYFDIAPSGLYSFDLSNTDFANISKDAIDVQMIARVKTAQNGFNVGDYIYPQFANYVGSTSSEEIGSTPYISGNVLSIRFGNTSELVTAGPNGAISGIYKAYVKVKLMLTTWIKEV